MRPPRRRASPSSSRRDAIVALGAIEHHEVLREALAVVVEVLDLHGAARPATGGQEAMAVGDAPALISWTRVVLRQRRPRDRERHDAAAVEIQDPANRAAERQLAVAVVQRRVPPHLLRERHAAQHTGEHLGQHIHRGAPTLVLAHADVFALRRLDALDLIVGHALLLREAGAGRRELAVRAECRRHRRPGDELFEIGLPLGDPSGTHRQPARRAEGLNRLVDGQPRFLQLRLEHLPDLRRQARQPTGGNLFGADFEQELPIHWRAPCGCSCST